MEEKTEKRPLPRLLAILAALMLIAGACGSSGTASTDTASEASTAADDAPGISFGADDEEAAGNGDTEAVAETEAAATTAPIATAVPTETPEPTATPLTTPTPEPLDVLTLADAKAGVSGVNWIAHFAGEEPWIVFDRPTGEEVDRLETEEWLTDWVRHLLVVSGSPDDEWVELLMPFEVEETAWVRSADVELVASELVVEYVRSTGALNVWSDGEIVWSAMDVTDRERHEEHTPIGVGYITGLYPSERDGFHETMVGLSLLGVNIDDDSGTIWPLAIRGVDGPESALELLDDADLKGAANWIPSDALDELIGLVSIGVRVEIVE